MKYWIEHTYKGYGASALPGKEMNRDAYETFSYAIGAFGFLIKLNEKISLTEWKKRISEYSGTPTTPKLSERLRRVLASIDAAMGKPLNNPVIDVNKILRAKKYINHLTMFDRISPENISLAEHYLKDIPKISGSRFDDFQYKAYRNIITQAKKTLSKKVLRKNPPRKKYHDIEEESSIAPWVAADAVHERAVVYLNNTGHHKEAEALYSKRNEISDYLADKLMRVYQANERFRSQVRRAKTVDKVHAFMEHWLAGWLKDKAPYILKLLPSGYGWSVRL